MMYSVIYSVDVPRADSIASYLPRDRKLWTTTEGDDQYEYGYLGGVWEKGKHRKLCACLTEEQFEQFLKESSLHAEDVNTMGSLGAMMPDGDIHLGLLPAVSFRADYYDVDVDCIADAYVTPVPEDEKEANEETFETVRRKMIERWG